MVVTYENPENREAKKINRTPIGTPQPPGPATTQTHRAAALTPQTRTVHRTTRRTQKNTQGNTRQTNNNRKQTQNNRRTNENTTLT
ncbi:MAG TPA: hypothetical protein VEL52_06045 [Candidatus Bathyarchaeia archaeon]|nr:hypothetical protein [Candidatus Bathyarchaeia archaeon]